MPQRGSAVYNYLRSLRIVNSTLHSCQFHWKHTWTTSSHATPSGELNPRFRTILRSTPPAIPSNRQTADREVVKSRDDCRRLKAWLSFVVRSNGRLTWDVFTPSVQLWQAFANDCSSKSKPIQALSDYATLLTKFTAQLAVQLGTSHPLYTALIANEGKPWHDAKFARIAASYKDARAAVRNASAAKAATSADPAKTSPVLEQAALPVPAYQLDIWLASAKTAMADHTSSTLTLQGVRQALAALPPPPPAPRRSSERSNSMAAAKRR